MPVKWKLFGIGSYIMLLFYLVILVVAIRGLPRSGSVENVVPITISIFFIVLNSGFNIYLFHKHFPDKPMSTPGYRYYKISTIVYTVSLAIILLDSIPYSTEAFKSGIYDSFFYFILLHSVIDLIALYILFLQYFVRKTIEMNFRNKTENQLMNLGKEN